MIFDRIRPVFFFVAFGLGLLYCYMMSPAPRVVIKFPTPYNVEDTLYIDKTDTCYKYAAEKLPTCPLNKDKIRMQPLPQGGAAEPNKS